MENFCASYRTADATAGFATPNEYFDMQFFRNFLPVEFCTAVLFYPRESILAVFSRMEIIWILQRYGGSPVGYFFGGIHLSGSSTLQKKWILLSKTQKELVLLVPLYSTGSTPTILRLPPNDFISANGRQPFYLVDCPKLLHLVLIIPAKVLSI